jgi:hypothetical protein
VFLSNFISNHVLGWLQCDTRERDEQRERERERVNSTRGWRNVQHEHCRNSISMLIIRSFHWHDLSTFFTTHNSSSLSPLFDVSYPKVNFLSARQDQSLCIFKGKEMRTQTQKIACGRVETSQFTRILRNMQHSTFTSILHTSVHSQIFFAP